MKKYMSSIYRGVSDSSEIKKLEKNHTTFQEKIRFSSVFSLFSFFKVFFSFFSFFDFFSIFFSLFISLVLEIQEK